MKMNTKLKLLTAKITAVFLAVCLLPVPPLYAKAEPTAENYDYILDMAYDFVSIDDDYVYFYTDGKWGKIDHQGNLIEKAVHNSFEGVAGRKQTENRSPLKVYKDTNTGFYGYLYADGAIAIPAQFIAAFSFNNDAAIVKYQDKFGIIDEKGNRLLDFRYDSVELSADTRYYAYSLNGKYGFIDAITHQKLCSNILRAESVSMFPDYVIYKVSSEKYGLASYDGKVLCGPIWDYMRDFSEGLAAVGVNEDYYKINIRWGYINTKGEIVIPAIYSCFNPAALDFSEGLAGVCDEGTGYYIDKNGDVVLTLDKGQLPYTGFSDGRAAIAENSVNMKYINKDGTVVAEPAEGSVWNDAGKCCGDVSMVAFSNADGTVKKYGAIRYTANIPSNWAINEISTANEAGLIPEDLQDLYPMPMSRADFCRLAVRLIEKYTGSPISTLVPSVSTSAFTDTNDPDVLYANALGIVIGRGNGIFDPSGIINREEAAKILVNTYKCCTYLPAHTQKIPSYNDLRTISSWAYEGIWYMGEWRVMIGVGNNNFDPFGSYTREQCMLTMIRLFDVLENNRPATAELQPRIIKVTNDNIAYNNTGAVTVSLEVPSEWIQSGNTFLTNKKVCLTVGDVILYPNVPSQRQEDTDEVYYMYEGRVCVPITLTLPNDDSSSLKDYILSHISLTVCEDMLP